MKDLDLLRGHEFGGRSVEAPAPEEAAPSAAAPPTPSTATDPAHHTRRSWSAEEKARIVAESDRPGAVQKEVAARHGITGQTLRQWRSRARARGLSGARGVAASGKRDGRPWPDDVKAQIVAESERPDASISAVARRHGISERTLRTWRRQAASGAGGDRRGAGSAPPYIPVVVDGAASEQTVAIEALGVVVRLPAESAVDRIVAVASGLGRASS